MRAILSIICALAIHAGLLLPQDVSAQEQPRSELRISTPDPGEVVQIPFTVSGVAPRGARLELWVGTQLERVFMADADGKFTVPVARRGEGAVIVHLMDKNGERLQSTSVDIIWGGAAANVTAATSPTSPSNQEPPEFDTPSSTEDVVGSGEAPAPAEPAALPKVSDLDEAYMNGTPLPEPARAQPVAAEAQAADGQVTAAGGSAGLRPKQVSRGVRGLAEAGVGVAAAVAGGFALGGIGLGLGIISQDLYVLLATTVVGGIAGLVIGLPIGVYFTGRGFDGNGKIWAVVLGEVGGVIAGGLIAGAVSNEAPGLGVFTIFAMPVLGAVLGYELSSDKSAWEAKQGISIAPAITPARDGTMTFGLKLQF